MSTSSRWLLAWGLLPLLAPACQSITGASDKNLMEVVDRFHHDLRWKYNQQAAARVPPGQVADFLEQLEDKQSDLNITAWDVRKVEYDPPDNKLARVRMHLEYYLMPSTVMQEVKVEEVWELRDKAWVCVSIAGGPIELEAQEAADAGVPDGQVAAPAPAGRPPVQDLPAESPDELP